MADKLQPCLLDRLADDDPKNPNESSSQRIIGLQRYRQGVLRDLEWLFGEGKYAAAGQLFAQAYAQEPTSLGPRAADWAYCRIHAVVERLKTEKSNDPGVLAQLDRELTEALYVFEPRIIPNSLKVRAQKRANIMTLSVEAELWASPVPEYLRFKTKLDLESGYCSIGS